jgi:hypothetical protein
MYRQDESIYALIPPEEMEQKKPPMYKSKFENPKANTKPYSMMGREVGKPDPQKFMKAGEKTKGQLAQPKPFARTAKSEAERKAAIPRRDEKPIYGLKTSKNYVTANAVENILQAPKRVPTTEPRFTAKEDYGKVPDYLVRIKQERNEEDEFIAHIQQMRAEQTGVKLLPEEERLKILAGLKQRWTELNKQYVQNTSFVISTERGRLRKENLEAQLTQVEKDIEKMSKKNIVIQEEQQYGYGY